ncbi:L-threonylcarbamoyladenylate synthase [Candidatus Kryptobacter tengchongensis]|uniref:L-threonylcarbamoyladenylate synthase n=1 Tax=Kryptobacter tengchongensis TaxID=1643429 RepID=UPI000707E46D|nr:L-threonylcarbamoyladenylate synthase [Candidatus Kryptobacter tengchongensis]CUS77638.1 L-threonylcarbamoyladenylate synthase [Candidatus Kryptobacter tengchongensis]
MKVKASPENIKLAGKIIKEGGLVAFPTETVYGLGANALNPIAVAKIFEVKNRPSFDPLIVHISRIEWLEKLTSQIDERAFKLIEKFWPGPLTLVLFKSQIVPDIVTAGLKTVAIRMPAHPVALELIENAQTPISAPSANPFGYISPTTADHVEKMLGDKIDLILDAGKCPIGVESTVLSLIDEEPKILRPGGLPVEEIEKIIGKVKIQTKSEKILSPGQLQRHYSPKTPVKIFKSIDEIKNPENSGILLFKKINLNIKAKRVEILSENGDLLEASANLFSALHRLDDSGVDVIYAQEVPETGLGLAIMDRLKKASAQE